MRNRSKEITGHQKEKRALIYVRVSTKEQVQNLSLDTQEKTCREHCAKLGFEVHRVYREEGRSAKTADRPELLKLLKECAKKKVVAVVVYGVNRLARQSIDHHALRAALKKQGVSLHSATEPIGDSPTEKLLESILADFSQFDNDMRSERTKHGMQEAVERGIWVSQPPLGYQRGWGDGRSLRHDPERAPHIRRIFERAGTGQFTQKDLLERATAEGLRNKKGQKLKLQAVSKLLRRPAYCGVIEWDGGRYNGDFDPIVDEDLFQRVQDLLDGKSPTAIPRTLDNEAYPLRRFIRCEECGSPITGSASRGRRGKKYPYYHCTQGHVRAPVSAFHEGFREQLHGLQMAPSYAKLFRSIVKEAWNERSAGIRQDQGRQQSKLHQIRTRLDTLNEKWLDGKIGDEEVTVIRERLRSEERAILGEGQSAPIPESKLDRVLDYAHQMLTKPAELWQRLPLQPRKQLQGLIFPDGLTYGPDGFGTPNTGPVFTYLRRIQGLDSPMASPRGFEPLLQP